MLVSAIVSTYKGERFIRGCLDDLVAQTLFAGGELEVVVVDSASPQGEGRIVEEFVTRYPRQFVYHRTAERETLNAAWNRGIKLARGKYVTNANVDDRHDPICLAAQAEALEAHPEMALVYPDSYLTTVPNLPFEEAPKERLMAWPDFDRDTLFDYCYFGPHPMWRKCIHDKLGYFDEAMIASGDYEFWLRISMHYPCLHLARPLSLYLENPSSISLSNVDIGWQEGEVARKRYWDPAWGEMPTVRRVAKNLQSLAVKATTLAQQTQGENKPLAIGIYGAGKHTQRMLNAFEKTVSPVGKIVAILDDKPRSEQMGGIAVHPTAAWSGLGLQAILVSSDTYEVQMAERLGTMLGGAVPIWKFYSN
ncbi:MAG: glycosyltransferase [Phycisphaerae bacterium]